jgi:hypothetical protein
MGVDQIRWEVEIFRNVTVGWPARILLEKTVSRLQRQINALLHEEVYSLNHAPNCDDAADGEALISAGVRVQSSVNRNQGSQKFTLDMRRTAKAIGKPTNKASFGC